MKYFAILSVFLINPVQVIKTETPENVIVDVDYAAQRCAARDCTCRVSLDNVSQAPDSRSDRSRRSIFFQENDRSVDPADLERISEILSENPGTLRFTIVGYTDGCGGSTYNYSLARDRAREVSRAISRMRPGSRFTIRAVSELSPGHSPGARKVDVIPGTILDPGVLYENLRADYYLVDASGSMSTYTSWMRAISSAKPRNARVYVSRSAYCHSGQAALSIRPAGSTEIWYSLWHTINLMSPGKKLIVVSDFQSRVPLSSSERATISRIIREKNLQVIGITP